MTSTARARALLIAISLWLLPGAALGQTSTPPDPNEGAFGQTISGADATPPNIPVVATPRAAPAGGPAPARPPRRSVWPSIGRRTAR